MKYSKQQIRDIDRHYENLKRQIQLTKLRSKGLQSVLVDKIIPDSILDKRNSNDIENDKFAETQLFNDYSNDIIKTGDVYKFQSDIEKGGYVKFFINNFPRIKKEVQMYRIANGKNVFDATKKLFNQEIAIIDSFDDKTNQLAHDQSMLGELQQISANLQTLAQLATNNDARNQYIDSQNKIDAVIACIQAVGNEVQVLQQIYLQANPGIQLQQIQSALAQLNQQTTPSANLSGPQPAPSANNPLFAQITQQNLQQVMNQTNQPQAQKPAIPNKNILTLSEQDIQDWKNFATGTKKIEFAEHLSDLVKNTKSPQDFMTHGNKKDMFDYFLSIRDSVVNQLLNEQRQAKESQLKQQEEEKELKQRDAEAQNRHDEPILNEIKQYEKIVTENNSKIQAMDNDKLFIDNTLPIIAAENNFDNLKIIREEIIQRFGVKIDRRLGVNKLKTTLDQNLKGLKASASRSKTKISRENINTTTKIANLRNQLINHP